MCMQLRTFTPTGHTRNAKSKRSSVLNNFVVKRFELFPKVRLDLFALAGVDETQGVECTSF